MINLENVRSWRRINDAPKRLDLTFNEAFSFSLHHPGSKIPDSYYAKASGGIVRLKPEQIRSITLNTGRDRFPRIIVEGQTDKDIETFTDILRDLNYQEGK